MIQKVKEVIQAQLRQGVSPKGLAMTCAFASTLGTFPILGTTTVLCFLVGFVFKLNQPLIQVLNYLLSPIQLLLIPVFLKAGQTLFQAPALTVNPLDLMKQFQADWKLFLSQYGLAGLQAIAVWLVLAPIIGFTIYFCVKPLLEKISVSKQQ